MTALSFREGLLFCLVYLAPECDRSLKIVKSSLSPFSCSQNPLCFLPGIECGVPPEFLPIIPGIGGTTGRGNIENLGNKEANGIAKEQGYRNAEDFKNGVVGKDAKNYNMAVDKGTGEIILTPVQKGGGPNVPTNIFRK